MGDTSRYPGLQQQEVERQYVMSWMKATSQDGFFETDEKRTARNNQPPDCEVTIKNKKTYFEVTKSGNFKPDVNKFVKPFDQLIIKAIRDKEKNIQN